MNYGAMDEPTPEEAERRRVEHARAAFQLGDKEASVLAHQSVHTEPHAADEAWYLKSMVYGGLDGIITTFAMVCGATGAQFPASVILILGLSNLFADGVAMGMGDYLSSKAERDYQATETAREQWEMDTNLPGEIEEMVQLYMQKGVCREDAQSIMNTLATKYPTVFLELMVVEELGFMPEHGSKSALKSGLVTAGSFVCFGAMPLVGFLTNLIPGSAISVKSQLISALVSALLTLTFLGSLKGTITSGGRWWWSAIEMVVNGSLAATIGYLIGHGTSLLLPPEYTTAHPM